MLDMCCMHACSVTSNSVTLWTIAHQAPPSLGFSRQEHWSDCHFLLKVIFPTRGWNPGLFGLLHWQADSLPLAPPGKPLIPLNGVRIRDFLDGSAVKNLPASAGDSVWSLGQEDSLEEETATHTSILTWKKSADRKAWWATIRWVAKSRTWLRDWACTQVRISYPKLKTNLKFQQPKMFKIYSSITLCICCGELGSAFCFDFTKWLKLDREVTIWKSQILTFGKLSLCFCSEVTYVTSTLISVWKWVTPT